MDKQKGVEGKDEKDKREELGPEGNGPDRKGGPTTGVVVPGSHPLSLFLKHDEIIKPREIRSEEEEREDGKGKKDMELKRRRRRTEKRRHETDSRRDLTGEPHSEGRVLRLPRPRFG